MAKSSKPFLAIAILSIVFCFGLGGNVFAATMTGTSEWFQWKYDSNREQLDFICIQGSPLGEERDAIIADIEKNGYKVRNYSYEDLEFDYPQKNKPLPQTGTYRGKVSEFTWSFDAATQTLKIDGQGDMPSYSGQANELNRYVPVTKHLIIGDGVTSVPEYLYYQIRYNELETITIGKSLKRLSERYYNYVAVDKIALDAENPFLASYNDALYTGDYAKLLWHPFNKETIELHKELKTLAPMSLNSTLDTVVIPSGVTTIQKDALKSVIGSGQGLATIILPDTLIFIDESINHLANNEHKTIIFSDKNLVAKRTILNQPGSSSSLQVKVVDSVASYYNQIADVPVNRNGWTRIADVWYYYQGGYLLKGWFTEDRQNNIHYYLDRNTGAMKTGLQHIDGKVYVFREDGVRLHSQWKRYGEDWYYLNAYGAGAVKYWAKSGSKWYYLKEDGKMAKSQWIEWYNKWYYVGSDGAMYVNRSTPDGRYVDGSGVRIR